MYKLNKIKNIFDNIIQNVRHAQSELIKLSLEVNETPINIEKSKKEFDEMTKQFDTLVIDDQIFKNIKQSLDVLNKDLKQRIACYNEHLIGNKKEIIFEDQLRSVLV